jgi:dolichol kinase
MLETKRHIFHIAFGTILALLYSFAIITKIHFLILLILSIAAFTLYKHVKIPILHQIMQNLERKENLRKFPGKGAIYYMLGCTIAAWLYSADVATASILILAWGDGMAGLARSFARKPNKPWHTTAIGIIAGTIASGFYAKFIPALAASASAMLLERIHWKIDDNLVVPIVAGAVIHFLG